MVEKLIPSKADAPLDEGAAIAGLDMLFADSSEAMKLMVGCGILAQAAAVQQEAREMLTKYDWPHDFSALSSDADGVFVFKNAAFNKVYDVRLGFVYGSDKYLKLRKNTK